MYPFYSAYSLRRRVCSSIAQRSEYVVIWRASGDIFKRAVTVERCLTFARQVVLVEGVGGQFSFQRRIFTLKHTLHAHAHSTTSCASNNAACCNLCYVVARSDTGVEGLILKKQILRAVSAARL